MDATIGDRLRKIRTERGLTQEELAGHAGVSVDLIKKLEQGRRQSARLTSLAALANALDVALSEFTDKRPRLDGAGDRLVLGLRDVLLTPDLLPGLEPDDPGEPASAEKVREMAAAGWRAYWGGRFVDLARTTPGLIGEARHAHRAGSPGGAALVSQAYQLSACLLVHLGRDDLALLGAERAITAATGGSDELQWATAHGTYSWVLMNQARNEDAERVAARISEQIEPRMSTATPAQLTVWGGMMLWAMAAASAAGRADTTMEYLSLAKAGAARLDGDRLDYALNFGPTQVAMQETYANVALDRPDRAIAAARQVRHEDLRPISQGRHLLDLTEAHIAMRHDAAAVDTLVQAKTLAPVWFRHQVAARTLVAEVCERKARLTPAMRDLVRALDPH